MDGVRDVFRGLGFRAKGFRAKSVKGVGDRGSHEGAECGTRQGCVWRKGGGK